MSSHPRPFLMGGGGNVVVPYSSGDTTFTKIFVGGLAWETQRETMRRYFEQFGEILEAVVITDKNTGRSKGYGFVTFKDPQAATRAYQNPSPVIDGRRANCNLAFLGAAQRPPTPTNQVGATRFWPPIGPALASSSYCGSSLASVSASYYRQPSHYPLPYSFYGYTGPYSQESVYPMGYYGLSGGQQQLLSPYYPGNSPTVYPNLYPYYTQYSQSSQAPGGIGMHYPQMLQHPYIPQFGYASSVLSHPTTIASTSAAVASCSSQPPGNSVGRRPTA